MELVTGALVLLAAAGGLAGPVIAGVLMYRSGAVRGGTAVAASLVLAVAAIVIAIVTAVALLVVARHRARPRVAADPRPAVDATARDRYAIPAHSGPGSSGARVSLGGARWA
ncbi:hypothetical protein [Nocardia sp. AG03]|uniref:hypothetical protein n=1 Tax=Nocardia sp. AG03 TaxID=3025312 RepID=UPI0024181BF3|nr:hypothetical protein [Nocardia sp. AG03]